MANGVKALSKKGPSTAVLAVLLSTSASKEQRKKGKNAPEGGKGVKMMMMMLLLCKDPPRKGLVQTPSVGKVRVSIHEWSKGDAYNISRERERKRSMHEQVSYNWISNWQCEGGRVECVYVYVYVYVLSCSKSMLTIPSVIQFS